MRQRSFIALAVALAILVVGAVGVYAYDKTRDDVIAKGVTAGGVDLSGMSPAKARDTLRRDLLPPRDETRTEPARGDLARDGGESGRSPLVRVDQANAGPRSAPS